MEDYEVFEIFLLIGYSVRVYVFYYKDGFFCIGLDDLFVKLWDVSIG